MKRRSISSCALFGSTQVVRLPSEAISLSATVDVYKRQIISTARQGIFLIPALLIFPRVFGLLGIQILSLIHI